MVFGDGSGGRGEAVVDAADMHMLKALIDSRAFKDVRAQWMPVPTLENSLRLSILK